MAINYEEIKATCDKCGNPVYIRNRDKKLVCSTMTPSGSGYIPLNERCFESKETVIRE